MIFQWLQGKKKNLESQKFTKEIWYLGEKYQLQAIGMGKRASTKFVDGVLDIQIPEKEFSRKKVYFYLAAWYKKEAKRLMIPLLVHLHNDFGLEYRRVSFKWLRSRFGSCSSRKNLNFNLILMQAPWEMTEYVIIHEYCHLRHMNHSKDFWDFVAEICPDYAEKKKWLKENGKHLFDFLRFV